MRLPVEVLQEHLAPMLQGLLLWSEDSKNKFRLKARAPAPSAALQGLPGSIPALCRALSTIHAQRAHAGKGCCKSLKLQSATAAHGLLECL
jgi:hypothetical protein